MEMGLGLGRSGRVWLIIVEGRWRLLTVGDCSRPSAAWQRRWQLGNGDGNLATWPCRGRSPWFPQGPNGMEASVWVGSGRGVGSGLGKLSPRGLGG